MMPLGQLGDAHPGSDALYRKLNTLEHSSLPPISLNDFSLDLGKFLFDFDHHRIANWCFQDSSAPSFLTWWRNGFSEMSVRKVWLTLPSSRISIEQGTCR
jgi:hypothetical protein